jgi:hypothetical protein
MSTGSGLSIRCAMTARRKWKRVSQTVQSAKKITSVTNTTVPSIFTIKLEL